MKVICEVLEEVTESFDGKRGPKSVAVWVCLDRDPEEILLTTFDYELNPGEHEKFWGGAKGKSIEICITEIRAAFGHRVRFKGRLRKFADEEVAA
jgi:hypothetical protein